MTARGSGFRHVNSSVAPVPPERLKWDALLVALAILLFFQVWAVQHLFGIQAVHGVLFVATCVTLLLFALDRDSRRRLSSLNQPVVRAALGLLLLATLSIPGSLDPGNSLELVLQGYLPAVVLMLLVAGSVRGVGDLRRLAWLLIAGLTLYSVVTIARSWTNITELNDRRWGGIVYSVNDLAMLIVSVSPLFLYLWRRPAGFWTRLLLTATAVFLTWTFGKAGSRGGFLALVAVVAYLLLRFRGLSRAKRAGVAVLVAILVVGLANSDLLEGGGVRENYFQRIQSLLHPSTDYNWSGKSEVGRLELWKRGIGYVLDHPLFGIGAGAYQVAEGTLAPEARVQQYGIHFKWSSAHNALLQVGAEIGIPGLILFVALLVAAFRTLSRIGRGAPGETAFLAQALIGCLIGFLVANMFLTLQWSAYFYTLLGMTVGLAKVASAVHASAPPAGRVWRRSVAAPDRRALTA